jgi:cell division FtsZ-interacting protein ZapD
MEKHLDVKNDYFYIKGRQDVKLEFVKNLLQKTDWTITKIVDVVGISVEIVESVKQKLSNKE